MPRPKYPRPDTNQAQLIKELYQLGARKVWNLSAVGGDCLDLLVLWRGTLRLIEVKRKGHEHELTEGERETVRLLREEMGYNAVMSELLDVMTIFK